jgi:hypothetical protein
VVGALMVAADDVEETAPEVMVLKTLLLMLVELGWADEAG